MGKTLLENLQDGLDYLESDLESGYMPTETVEAEVARRIYFMTLPNCKPICTIDGNESAYLTNISREILNSAVGIHLEPLFETLKSCASPIERIFISAFWAAATKKTLHSMDSGSIAVVLPWGNEYGRPFAARSITIEPQVEIAGYRVDFRITRIEQVFDSKRPDSLQPFRREVIVECDGHDFHEKTKQQAIKDKNRDRKLQMAGPRVFHFTGSEIWNDPMAAAIEVCDFMEPVCDGI